MDNDTRVFLVHLLNVCVGKWNMAPSNDYKN